MLDATHDDHRNTLDLSTQVVQRIDGLGANEKNDQLIKAQLAEALVLRGDQLRALNRPDEAARDWLRAVTELGSGQKHEDASTATTHAAALSRLGRSSEAATIVARLEATGYRHPAFIAITANSSARAVGEIAEESVGGRKR